MKALDDEFSFTLDPCPIGGTGGLDVPWHGRVYVNPPYGKGIDRWLKKGLYDILSGDSEVVVFLLPARTDTRWFHDWVLPFADEIRFIKGRLKFSGHKNSAPFPSMIVVFSN